VVRVNPLVHVAADGLCHRVAALSRQWEELLLHGAPSHRKAHPDVFLLQRHRHGCADDLLAGLRTDALLAEVIENNVGRSLALAETRNGGLAVNQRVRVNTVSIQLHIFMSISRRARKLVRIGAWG
jgi:hypothetical protein